MGSPERLDYYCPETKTQDRGLTRPIVHLLQSLPDGLIAEDIIPSELDPPFP